MLSLALTLKGVRKKPINMVKQLKVINKKTSLHNRCWSSLTLISFVTQLLDYNIHFTDEQITPVINFHFSWSETRPNWIIYILINFPNVRDETSLVLTDILPKDTKTYDKNRPPKYSGQPTVVNIYYSYQCKSIL